MTSVVKIVFGIIISFLLMGGLVSHEWEYECYIVQLPIYYNRVSINGIEYHNKIAWINHDSIADLITKKKGKRGYELVDVTPHHRMPVRLQDRHERTCNTTIIVSL